MKRIIFRCRLFCSIGLFFIIFLLFFYKIVPGGAITYTKNYEQRLSSGKGFIYNFSPADRVIEGKFMKPKLIGDPIYFSVFTPRTFSQARLKIFYKNHLDESTPIIEAGILADSLLWRYDLKSIENKILDNILNSKPHNETPSILEEKIDNKNMILWQRHDDYNNIDEFLLAVENNNLKSCSLGYNDCLATYNYPLNIANFKLSDELLADISHLDENKSISSKALKGSHTLWLYLHEDQSSFSFSLDLSLVNNSYFKKEKLIKDIDDAKILLFRGSELVFEKEIASLIDLNQLSQGDLDSIDSPLRWELSLNNLSLDQGNYKLEIKISNDLIIENLQSTATLTAFLNHLYLLNNENELSIFSDLPYLQIKTMSLGPDTQMSFAGQEFSLDKLHLQKEVRLNPSDFEDMEKSDWYEAVFNRGDYIIENGGLISFNQNVSFNPFPQKIDRFFNLEEQFNYVIADYQAPIQDEGLNIASVEFSLIGKYREKGKYNFMISIPGLRAENQLEDNLNYLEIQKIELELKGRSLWEKLFNCSDRYK